MREGNKMEETGKATQVEEGGRSQYLDVLAWSQGSLLEGGKKE